MKRAIVTTAHEKIGGEVRAHNMCVWFQQMLSSGLINCGHVAALKVQFAVTDEVSVCGKSYSLSLGAKPL